jgi:Ca2+:H+ antiporter
MDTAMTICFQSSLQIALFVTPICVLISMLFPLLGFEHARYASLVFSPMEVVAVMMTVFVVVIVSLNGQSNWFEGVLLLGLYAILGIAFFYIPVPGQGAVRMTTMP